MSNTQSPRRPTSAEEAESHAGHHYSLVPELREAVKAAKSALKAAEARLREAELDEARCQSRTAWLASDERVEEVILDNEGHFVYKDTAYGDLIRRVLVVDGETVWDSYGVSLRLFSSEETARAWNYSASSDE